MPNFQYIRKLGEGGFGEVWLVHDRGVGADRAVKFVSPSAIPDLEAYNAEAHVLYELRHPNVVEVYATEIVPEDDPGPGAGMYAIVMEYMPEGSLADALSEGVIPLRRALRHVSEACRGAERAHASGYVHRDIKPANILTAPSRTKLSDFGLCVSTLGGLASPAGTMCYVAPEVITTGTTTKLSDVYSLGVTTYELINGASSLDWYDSEEALAHDILRGRFPDRQAYQPFVPAALRKVITKAMNPAPEKRYTSVEDFRHALMSVPIQCDWLLESAGDPEVWLGLSEYGMFRVTVSASTGTFELARCATAPGNFRKVTSDCVRDSDVNALRKHQAEVMQRITTHGR